MRNVLVVFIVLFLLSFSSFAQSVNSPIHHDKLKHIYVGAAVGAGGAFMFKEKAVLKTSVLVGGVSVAKEFYDWRTGGDVEVLDVVYGTASAVIVCYSVKFIRKKWKRKTLKN